MLGLYHNEGNGLFVDEAPSSSVGRESLLSLAFGVFFFDYDLDGYSPILLAANGHIEEGDRYCACNPGFTIASRRCCSGISAGKKFENMSTKVGQAFTQPKVGRGAIYGDYDHDGDLDVLITGNSGPAHLFRNDGGNKNHWLSVRTVGTKSNRDGIGAVVRIESASGKQWNMVRSGSSYAPRRMSLALTFGLAQDPMVTSIQIEWPSGA